MEKIQKKISDLLIRVSIFGLLIIASSLLTFCSQGSSNSVVPMKDSLGIVTTEMQDIKGSSDVDDNSPVKIQIALILDTSGSMEGLIEQAKSQLWSIVKELTHVRYHGRIPTLEIALYEYGNDGIASSDGWVSLVLPFTTDLDEISGALFALTTNGGAEYCGLAIHNSITELNWSDSKKDIKTIYIAGNEPFTQGTFNYRKACEEAKEMDVVVNTIHCGDFNDGIDGQWQSGAMIAGGDYMAINYNRRTVYIKTPYDEEINILGIKLNDTYIYYGSSGAIKMKAMEAEDINSNSYGSSNLCSRNEIKATSLYNNSSWDLVDAYNDESIDVKEIEREYLPEWLRNMNDDELEGYIKKQAEKRKNIQDQIKELSKKRDLYLAEHKSESEADLQSSMLNSIKKQAISKGYKL